MPRAVRLILAMLPVEERVENVHRGNIHRGAERSGETTRLYLRRLAISMIRWHGPRRNLCLALRRVLLGWSGQRTVRRVLSGVSVLSALKVPLRLKNPVRRLRSGGVAAGAVGEDAEGVGMLAARGRRPMLLRQSKILRHNESSAKIYTRIIVAVTLDRELW